MTTRRFSRTVRAADGELFPELLDVLVTGWSAPIRPDEPDPFRIFYYQDADLLAVFERHRARILSEARRRGIEPWIVEHERQFRAQGRRLHASGG